MKKKLYAHYFKGAIQQIKIDKYMHIQAKLPRIGTSIFTVMSKMAKEYNAINLSQGFPNFDTANELKQLVTKYMREGHNQYAPMQGVASLRARLADKAFSLYGTLVDADSEITITAGATQAIYTAISAFVKEGEEVIIFEPAYDSYAPSILLNGARPKYVQLEAPDYKIPWDKVRWMINSRTRMMILNSPHNPTGTILTAEDIEELKKVVANTDVLLLSDEVYEHIVFDSKQHESFLRHPELWKRSLITYSFGKTYHSTGWKIGYCMAPDKLMQEFRRAHQFIVFSVNTPMQYALADYLKEESKYLNLSDFYQKKRDYFLSLIEGSRFQWTPTSGSYFQLLDYSAITDEKDTAFAERLTKELGVASIPISVFYNKGLDQKMLRFCFAKTDETLEQAAELLRKV